MKDWLNKRCRLYWYDQYANNNQKTAFSKYDPDRIADEHVEIGSDIVAVYATNQFGIAYYPSKIWPQHPGLNGRDYFGEVSAKLREKGKKIIAYINYLDSKHPEWNIQPIGTEPAPVSPLVSWADPLDTNGSVQDLPGGSWNVPCYNSPHREDILAIADEIAGIYRPELFHLDMFFYSGVCVCPYCAPSIREIIGSDEITMDAIYEHWIEYVNWRNERSSSLIAELSRTVRKYGCATAHNAFAPLYISPVAGLSEQWLDHLDVFLSECFDAFTAPCTDLNSTSIMVKWQHAVNKPSWVLRTGHQNHFAHWPISDAQWELYAAACKTNGTKAFGPCGVGAKPDTTTADIYRERVKRGFGFYMQDSDLDDGAVSAAKTALIYSWPGRHYMLPEWSYVKGFTGWARLLIEKHIPYDIVTDDSKQSALNLSGYDLVILPESTYLSDACISALNDYVHAGGKLIFECDTARYDEKGQKRLMPDLHTLSGIEITEVRNGPFAIEKPLDCPPFSGRLAIAKTDAEVLARVVNTDPAGSVCGVDDPMPMEVSDIPLAILNNYGNGKSLYIACNAGKYYTEYGDESTADWMAEMIDAVLPKKQIDVEAPSTVEVSIWEQNEINRTIVHLANRTVSYSLPTTERQIREIIPVHNIILYLPGVYDNCTVKSRHSDITVLHDKDALQINIDKLNAYAAVIIEKV